MCLLEVGFIAFLRRWLAQLKVTSPNPSSQPHPYSYEYFPELQEPIFSKEPSNACKLLHSPPIIIILLTPLSFSFWRYSLRTWHFSSHSSPKLLIWPSYCHNIHPPWSLYQDELLWGLSYFHCWCSSGLKKAQICNWSLRYKSPTPKWDKFYLCALRTATQCTFG